MHIYNSIIRRFVYLLQILGLCKDKKVSTSKSVLEKCDNPISSLIISWRKLNATKTKVIMQ